MYRSWAEYIEQCRPPITQVVSETYPANRCNPQPGAPYFLDLLWAEAEQQEIPCDTPSSSPRSPQP